MKKKLMALLLACALCVSVFSGCSQGGGESGSSEAAPSSSEAGGESSEEAGSTDEPQTLRIAWWGNSARDQLHYEINDIFIEEHPNVTIETQSPGWDDYWVKMAADYASGNAADIVQFQANQIGEYCSKGVVAPLQPYIDNGTISLDNWNMDFVNTGMYEGTLYMLTVGMTTQCMYINNDLVKEAGLELWDFEEDITWDEYFDFLRQLQASKPGSIQYVANDTTKNNDLFWIWIRQNVSEPGVEWVNDDGSFAPTKDTLTRWFQMSLDMVNEGIYPPATWQAEDDSKAWQENAFATGQVVLRFENANKYKIFATALPDMDIQIRRVPTQAEGEDPQCLLITTAFGISETAENKQLCAEWINFFCNDERAQKIYNQEVGVVGNLDMQELLAADNQYDQIATEYLNLAAAGADPFVPKAPGVWAIQNEIAATGSSVCDGAMSPEEAADYIISIGTQTIIDNAEG